MNWHVGTNDDGQDYGVDLRRIVVFKNRGQQIGQDFGYPPKHQLELTMDAGAIVYLWFNYKEEVDDFIKNQLKAMG